MSMVRKMYVAMVKGIAITEGKSEVHRYTFSHGLRMAAQVIDGRTIRLTIARKKVPVGKAEITVIKRDCAIPPTARLLTGYEQVIRVEVIEGEPVPFYTVTYEYEAICQRCQGFHPLIIDGKCPYCLEASPTEVIIEGVIAQ